MKSIISHSKPTLSSMDIDAVKRVLHSGMIASGEQTAEFENRVAEYLNLESGAATASGSSALYLCLKALGVGKGDEVILPTYVCISVLNAVKQTGANPVLCDIDENWGICLDTVIPHISPKTKAIVAPYIGGIAFDIKSLVELDIPVIEDLAQAFGVTINGRKAGTYGQITMCSFQAIKCLTSGGEGGMVLSNDKTLMSHIRSKKIYSPMSDLQAAVGISQLEQYPSFLKRRKQIADQYFNTFDRFQNMCMPLQLRKKSIFFRFPLIISQPFEMIKQDFENEGIAVRQFIDFLLHKIIEQPKDIFPMAELHFRQTLSIPIYPSLHDSQVEYITKTGEQIFRRYDNK